MLTKLHNILRFSKLILNIILYIFKWLGLLIYFGGYMVSNVSFGGGYNVSQYSKDLENAAKYAVGSSIVSSEVSPFEGFGIMLGITGLTEAPRMYKKIKEAGGIAKAWEADKATFKVDLEAKKALLGNGGWKNPETIKGIWNNYSANVVKEAIPTGEKLAALENAAKTDPTAAKALFHYKEAGRLAGEAVKNPAKAAEYIADADKALAVANHSAHGLVPATTKLGKIAQVTGKYTGLTKLNGAAKGLATESKIISKALKFGKGSGVFLAISGAVELFTNVIPTFTQLGAGKGLKQTGKSAVKVGASVGGWVAGAAVGAAIGSVIPGAGTVIGGAIGALCGLVGGLVGSWGASKVADKVVGKNELDIAKDEEAQKLSQEAKKNPEVAQQIMVAAGQKYQEEGGQSEDAKIAIESLNNLSKTSVAQSQYQPTQNPFQFQQQYSPNMMAYPNSNVFAEQDFFNKDVRLMNNGLV